MIEIFQAENLVALLTLVLLEIVLGIDNVIFIAILSGKLPQEQQARARSTGIALAVLARIVLLFSIAWIMRLTFPLFTLFDHDVSGRDLILLVGGLFLIGKSTFEIHEKLESAGHDRKTKATATFVSVITQIIIVDLVFSLDSVITAVGISGNLWVMVPAIVAAAAVMLIFAGPIASFVERHPTTKILALAFLILIGFLLVLEGWLHEAVEELHLKNYAYFAMAFSLVVELINLRVREKSQPVHLHSRIPTIETEEEMDEEAQSE
ncbi:MAG: TerC family protein [Caldilineaceae bacterium]|nr:TerC family protein [Caldilineaceae bacterium]MDE0339790.1 TerC family protein [Caldilineaceae bacterium]